jgi:hypothetical protein
MDEKGIDIIKRRKRNPEESKMSILVPNPRRLKSNRKASGQLKIGSS